MNARVRQFVLVSCLFLGIGLPAAASERDALVEKLHDSDAEVRVEALRELQVTLDPRLPEEMLRLLDDEGDSIRRLAARGIGSRYWQIAAAELGNYLPPLRKLASQRESHDGPPLMAERAIGLLTRNYLGEMFAPSPDGKWVIYERYSRPCIIDVHRSNEELLGWPDSSVMGFASSWGGGTLKGSAYWHPKSRAVALDIILGRIDSTIWVWTPVGSALTKLSRARIARALGEKNFDKSYLFASGKGWKGDRFVFHVESDKGEGFLAWDLKTGELRRVPGFNE